MFRPIVLLGSVNVGGTGKIAMSDLRSLSEELGCRDVRSPIASGNVVLDRPLSSAELKAKRETRLASHLGKHLAVALRTPDELTAASSGFIRPSWSCP